MPKIIEINKGILYARVPDSYFSPNMKVITEDINYITFFDKFSEETKKKEQEVQELKDKLQECASELSAEQNNQNSLKQEIEKLRKEIKSLHNKEDDFSFSNAESRGVSNAIIKINKEEIEKLQKENEELKKNLKKARQNYLEWSDECIQKDYEWEEKIKDLKERLIMIVQDHKGKDIICCPESCLCWDINNIILYLESISVKW